MIKHILLASIFVIGIPVVAASSTSHSHTSKYSGQETRTIKSLSPSDIEELRRGGGWGLAKAAELNGVPGPAHLLELKAEISLSESQVELIEKIYVKMKAKAIELGKKLITQEQELETHFQESTINTANLRSSLDAIAETRKELRYVHLETHLQTPKILTQAQIDKYNQLRGYSTSNPCDKVPTGHNPDMWRQHNGCQ